MLFVKDIKYKVGLSTVILGVTVGMLLNLAYPIIKWSPVIMLFSVLLLINRNIFKISAKINKYFVLIISFQLYMLVYWAFKGFQNEMDVNYLSFHLYILALSFVLIQNKTLKMVNFLPTLFWISGILSIIAAILTYLDLVQLRIPVNNEDILLDAFTLNIASYTNFIAALCLFSCSRKKWWLFFFFFMLLDAYVIIESGKRSYFVMMLVATTIYFYKTHRLMRSLAYSVIALSIAFVTSPQIREISVNLLQRTIDGISVVYMLDDKSYSYDENDSAIIRKYNKEVILRDVDENFGLLNVIYGKGYLYAFIDNPLLESFLDMGIMGIYYYCYLIIIIPLSFFRRIRGDDTVGLFIFLYSLINLSVIITNNNPYQYFAYVPVCFIAMRS